MIHSVVPFIRDDILVSKWNALFLVYSTSRCVRGKADIQVCVCLAIVTSCSSTGTLFHYFLSFGTSIPEKDITALFPKSWNMCRKWRQHSNQWCSKKNVLVKCFRKKWIKNFIWDEISHLSSTMGFSMTYEGIHVYKYSKWTFKKGQWIKPFSLHMGELGIKFIIPDFHSFPGKQWRTVCTLLNHTEKKI